MYLKRHFVTKNMRCPKYFLGIEVAHQKHSILLSQRKYALDLLEEAGLLRCKHATTPMKANVGLWFDDSHTLDPRYRRLIGKLKNLMVTRSDITFVIGVLSRFMHQPRDSLVSCEKSSDLHQELSNCTRNMGMYIFLNIRIQVTLVTEETKSTTGYYNFIGGNLVTRRSKK